VPVKIEDAGVCKKKLLFEVPQEEIQTAVNKTLDELTTDSHIPGFRPGHAPRRLVERKLREEIRDKVRAELIAEVYKKAVEENKLDVLREEDFDPAKIEMPADGPMKFEVLVEVRPEIALPDYAGIPVEVVRPAVADADVEAALAHLLRSRGRFTEQPAGTAIEERDMISADVAIAVGEETILEQKDTGLAVFPQALAGIHFDNVVAALAGKTTGDTVTITAKVPEKFDNEALRGQEAWATIIVKSIRRIALPPLDETFAKSVGFASVEEVRKTIREKLTHDAAEGLETAKREVLAKWLLDHVAFEVPQGVAASNAGRIFNRQVVSLQKQGVPVHQIEEKAEELMEACKRRSQTELKLSFITQEIAQKEKMETTEDEVQARVQMIAQGYQRPADRVYEDMEKNGYLDALREQIRDDKVFALLLSKAVVTEKDAPPPAPPEAQPATEKPAHAKKSAKAKAETADDKQAEEEKAEKPARKRKSPKAKGDAADQETT
jgi:trigger factor